MFVSSMSEEIITALRDATEGLLYMSESDESFEIIDWRGGDRCLDEPNMVELSGHQPGTPIETVPLDTFFANLITDRDWHGEQEKADVQRYRNLLKVIKQNLLDASAFRIGEIEVDIFIIGRTP